MSGRGRHLLRSGRAFLVLLLITVALIGWATVRSPVFELREVRISGTSALGRADVLRLASIGEGDNLLLEVSADEVRAGLERSPWIAEATVERHLPATLIVTIRERAPVAWIDAAEGGVVVAADGTVLERRDRRPAGLPRVGRIEEPPLPGRVAPGMRSVLRVSGSFPEALRRRVAAAAQEGSEVTLHLREGGTVIYGPPSSLDAKNQAVLSMLDWADGRRVEIAYIDIRAPGAPVLRTEEGG